MAKKSCSYRVCESSMLTMYLLSEIHFITTLLFNVDCSVFKNIIKLRFL